MKSSIALFVLCFVSVLLALSTHSYVVAGLNAAGVIFSSYDIYRSLFGKAVTVTTATPHGPYDPIADKINKSALPGLS